MRTLNAPSILLALAALGAGCNTGLVRPSQDVVVIPDDDDATTPPAGDDDTVGDDDDTGDDDTGDDDTGDDDTGDDDTGDDDDTTPPPPPPVRFVVMGDTGDPGPDQDAVAAAIVTVCAAQGCDFVLLTGDNFYDEGVEDVNDPLWDTAFEIPYANIDLPFYPVLGNHDGGALGTGLDVLRGQVQVDYSAQSTKWVMPDRWYTQVHENVEIFALDTSLAFFDGLPIITSMVDDQATWLQGALAASTAQWKIAYAHHPYLSNGPHGNAGNYEGLPSFTPFAAGTEVKDFLDDYVCGEVDLYLCGHDHSRQWLSGTCAGTQLIVSGGGAKRTDLDGTNPVWWQDTDDSMEGFVWIEIVGNQITVEFWDKNAQLEYSGGWSK